MADHYRTLGVAPTADEAVIRAVYVALMKRFHPDRSTSPDDLRQAQAITAAYAVLSDPQRRAAYDGERARLDPWQRGAALPSRKRGGASFVMTGFALALVAGAIAVSQMLPQQHPTNRGAAASGLASVPAHCMGLADPERVRTALIMRLDEVGALEPTVAGALTAARFDLTAPTDARDLAAPGRLACLTTLAITLPAQFSTASGQGTILSELQFSASKTEPETGMIVHPDGRLVAALSGIRHQPSLAEVANPMLEEDAPVIVEPPVNRPMSLPQLRSERAAPVFVPREPAPEPVRAATRSISPPVRGVPPKTATAVSDLGGVDRQTMSFYGQSLRNAKGDKKNKLEASQAGFVHRLAACGTDACRKSAYLARNVEISRIMMGQ